MRRVLSILLVLTCATAACLAQDGSVAVFTPPQAYPMDRYEAAWAKNPFTLKTAPAVVENVSFAKDLAIGGHFGDKENPTIIVVNTKTNERTRLKRGGTASNGMVLSKVTLGYGRKDTVVEVTLGSETTELHYDSDYLNQVAAAGGGGKAPHSPQQLLQQQQQGRIGAPNGMPAGAQGLQQRPGTAVPPKIQLPNGNPGQTRAGTAGVSMGGQGGIPMGGGSVPNVTANVSNNGNGINLSVSSGNAVQTPQNGDLISQVNPNAAPVPIRRRLTSAPTNEQTLPQ